MAKMCYVDVSRTVVNGKGRQKLHCVYDGQKIIKIRRLTKLRNAGEIYIDTLFPEVYDEVLELLKRGVKVYLLKYPSMLKKLRRENNVRKSDEVDALMLSKIPRECFKALTIEEIEKKIKVQPLINRYELLSRRIKALKMWIKGDGYDYRLRDSIRLMEKDKEETAKEIIKMTSNDTIYREACKLLGFNDSVEVAILTIGLPLHLPLNILKKIVGLTPNHNKGKYNRRIRTHISQLATSIYMNAKQWRDRYEVPEEFREVIDSLPLEKAIYRLQSRILKMFRKAYFLANQPTANNPTGR
ncbi:MAG: hypothetical protein LZ174_08590 [Thaumarchaeota archaeon]|jgi:hypothetical protein|nr:hypothetical protein [Candidatus Geocrenenecus arthurdayi]